MSVFLSELQIESVIKRVANCGKWSEGSNEWKIEYDIKWFVE